MTTKRERAQARAYKAYMKELRAKLGHEPSQEEIATDINRTLREALIEEGQKHLRKGE